MQDRRFVMLNNVTLNNVMLSNVTLSTVTLNNVTLNLIQGLTPNRGLRVEPAMTEKDGDCGSGPQ